MAAVIEAKDAKVAKVVRLNGTEKGFLQQLPMETSKILDDPNTATTFGSLGRRGLVEISDGKVAITALGEQTLEAQETLPSDDAEKAQKLTERLAKNPGVVVYYHGPRTSNAELLRLRLKNAEAKLEYNTAILSQYPDSKPQFDKVEREKDEVVKIKLLMG